MLVGAECPRVICRSIDSWLWLSPGVLTVPSVGWGCISQSEARTDSPDQWEAGAGLTRSHQTIITRGRSLVWWCHKTVECHSDLWQFRGDRYWESSDLSLCIYSLNDVLICLMSCWYKTNKERPDQMRSRDIVTLMDEARDTRGQTWRRLDKTALFEPHQPGTSRH